MYWVYILFSPLLEESYVGHTNDLEGRIIRHNKGMVPSTKVYRPWMLIHCEQFKTRAEAMRREKWFKTGVGRKDKKRLIDLFKKRTANASAEGGRPQGLGGSSPSLSAANERADLEYSGSALFLKRFSSNSGQT